MEDKEKRITGSTGTRKIRQSGKRGNKRNELVSHLWHRVQNHTLSRD